MQMNEAEIVRRYKDRKGTGTAQVQILADLNGCDKEKIIEILKEQGIEIKELPRNRKLPVVAPAQQKGTTTEPVKETMEPVKETLPDIVKHALIKQMVEEQEAEDKHLQNVKMLNDYLTQARGKQDA